MAKRNLVPTIQEVLQEMEIEYIYMKSASEFDISWGAEQHTKVFIASAENYKRIAGLNLAFFGVDEVDLIDIEIAIPAWRMLESRLRKGRVFQGTCASTPEGFNFMHQFFVEENVDNEGNPMTNRKLYRASTYDNYLLPSEYIPSMLQKWPANQIQAYLHGQFVNLTTGNVYHSWDRVKNYTTRSIKDYQQHILHVGMDFNVGKMAAAISVIDKKIVYTIDEIVDIKNTPDMVVALKKRFPERLNAPHSIQIYPDSSGNAEHSNATATDIALLKQAGFTVIYHKKNPRVRDRIASVNAMACNAAGQHRWFVNIERCPALVIALEQQGYTSDGKPDKSKGIDHIIDAFGYFCWWNFPIMSKTATARTI